MSLRIKLSLFTVCFVLLASLAILALSVLQTRQREEREIQRLRSNEMRRLETNLQNSLDLIGSTVEDQFTDSTQINYKKIITKVKRSVASHKEKWIWFIDTGDIKNLINISLHKNIDIKTVDGIDTLINNARINGFAAFESSAPTLGLKDSSNIDQSHLYWHAKKIENSNWVIATAVPLSKLDSVVEERSVAVENEITRIIKDRMLFSFTLIFLSAIAIFFFSKMISDPLNKLVNLTESIVEGRKNFSHRIELNTKDEIGRLSRSFNLLLHHIQLSMNKLEDTAAKYRELVENANSAIIHINWQGNVLFINEYAENLFGFSSQEVIGKNIIETIGKSVDVNMLGDDMFLSPEQYPYLERQHITKAGNHIWVGWTNRPILDQGKNIKETLCVGSDITKSKEAEELAAMQQRKLIQADKMATLGVLVSGVAHEINNPNNYIVLNAQTLQGMWNDISPVLESFSVENPDYAVSGLAYREIGKEIPGMLKGIVDGSFRIKHIVQNLKDFSRMEPDDMSQKIDIVKVLDAAQVILGNCIKKSTNNFRVKLINDIPIIRGNFQRIEQVIINLLTNACQANNDPSKPIEVTGEYNFKNNEITITVKDQGKGISPQDMKRIFDPFFTTKRNEGGTGLGLAVSYSIVKDHGGDLKIHSIKGEGTTAVLTLPIS